MNTIDIKIKDLEEHKNYTTLLLNCYVMEDDFEKLKNFIDKKGNTFSEDITKSIIDICLETEKIDLSLQISKQFKLSEEYLKIIITK